MAEKKRGKKYAPPSPKMEDGDHALARAGLSLIPVVGGAAAELFGSIVVPPLQKRQQEWMERVGQALLELENKIPDFDMQELAENEQFLTAVLHATRSATAAHQEEKREALRNAVLNVAVGSGVDEDQQRMFLRFIDELTPWHLRILRLFKDPKSYAANSALDMQSIGLGSTAYVIQQIFPALKDKRAVYEQMVVDLRSRGLLAIDNLNVTMTGVGMFQKRTTRLGDLFLDFIEIPLKD